MTHTTEPNLDKQIQKILQDFMYNATPVNLNYLKGEHDATQSIKALITDQMIAYQEQLLKDYKEDVATQVQEAYDRGYADKAIKADAELLDQVREARLDEMQNRPDSIKFDYDHDRIAELRSNDGSKK